jgi:hypothetical protein
MAKSRSNPAPKVQNIKKVKDGRVKTIFKKSSELYRSMLHNGQGKDCRFTVVVEYSGNCDVFVSDTGRKSTILDFNVSAALPLAQRRLIISSPYRTRLSILQQTSSPRPKPKQIEKWLVDLDGRQPRETLPDHLERS